VSEAALLRWCNTQLRDTALTVSDWGASFASGVALCAIVHRVGSATDASVALAATKSRDARANVTAALTAAVRLGVDEGVATVDDILSADPSLVMTFVAALFRVSRTLLRPASALSRSTPPAPSAAAAAVASSRSSQRIEETPCAKCAKPLSGGVVEHQGVKYHASCFGCHTCGKPLGEAVVTLRAKPFCATCAKAQLVELRTKALKQQQQQVQQPDAGAAVPRVLPRASLVENAPSKPPPARPQPVARAAPAPARRAAAVPEAAPTTPGGPADAAELAKRRAAVAAAKARREAEAGGRSDSPGAASSATLSGAAAESELAEAKRKRDAVAAERAKLVADAKLRQEAKRVESLRAKADDEAEAVREAQEAEERKRVAAELARKRREAEEARQAAELKRAQDEEDERRRKEEADAAAEQARKRKLAADEMAAARKRREEEEAARKRRELEEAEAEAARKRKLAADEAERKRKAAADEAAARKRREDEARREEEARRKKEQEERRRIEEEDAAKLAALAAEEERLLREEEEQLERERLEAEAEAAMWEKQLAEEEAARTELVPIEDDVAPDVATPVPAPPRESDVWASISAATAASAATVIDEPVDEDWAREMAELDALSSKDLFAMRQSEVAALTTTRAPPPAAPVASPLRVESPQRAPAPSSPYAHLPGMRGPAAAATAARAAPVPQRSTAAPPRTGPYAHLPGAPRAAAPSRSAPTRAARRPVPAPPSRAKQAPVPVEDVADEDDNVALAATAISGVDLAALRTSTAEERRSAMDDFAALDAILGEDAFATDAAAEPIAELDDDAVLALDIEESEEERQLRLEVEQLEREERQRQASAGRQRSETKVAPTRPAPISSVAQTANKRSSRASTMAAPERPAPSKMAPTRSVRRIESPTPVLLALPKPAAPAPAPALAVQHGDDEFDFDLDAGSLAEAASAVSMREAKPTSSVPSDEDILNALLGEGVDVEETVSRLTQILSAPAPAVKSVVDLVREADEEFEQRRASLRAEEPEPAVVSPRKPIEAAATKVAAEPKAAPAPIKATPASSPASAKAPTAKPAATKGWLSKQAPSGVVKMWKKRFFVLQDDKLLYFDDADLSNTLGVIGLEGASVCATPQGKSGQFQIIAPGRIFHLQAPSEESMEMWLKNLRVGCAYADQRSAIAENDSQRAKLREGQLLRMAGNKWRDAFAVLSGGVLRVLNGDKHGQVVATIALYEATFGPFDPDMPPPNLETTTVGMIKSLLGTVSNFDHTFEVVGPQRSVVLKCYKASDHKEWLAALDAHKKAVERTLSAIQ
jgi:hypothetical protein